MAAKRKRVSAAGRAWKSVPATSKRAIKQAHGIRGKATRSQRNAMGKIVRRGRLASGRNPNTGGTWRAGQLGLTGQARSSYKALTPRAKQGMVKAVAGKAGGRRGVARRVKKHYRKSGSR